MNNTVFSKEINANALSQSRFIGQDKTFGLAAVAESAPFTMLKTMEAIRQPNNFSTRTPLDFDVLGFVRRITNGCILGSFNNTDPETVRLVLQDVANVLPRNRSIWRDLTIHFIGSGEKARINEVRMDYPRDVIAFVKKHWDVVDPIMNKFQIDINTSEGVLLREYCYEFLSAQALRFCNSNGWINQEMNVTRRLPPVTGIMQYSDIRTVITMYELLNHLERYDTVDWKKAYNDYLEFDPSKNRHSSNPSRRRVSATGMSSSIVNAIALSVMHPPLGLSGGEVVDSVMFCLVRRWYPEIPLPAELIGVVDSNDMLADLSMNHAFFHMHQANISEGNGVYTLRHPVPTLAPTVFVHFKRAIDALLPYRVVTIGEAVQSISITSVYDHLNRPTLRHVRERVVFEAGTDVFHISTLEDQTYIDSVATLGTRIDSIAEVVAQAVRSNNVDSVDRMIHEETRVVDRFSSRGSQLVINYDSMIDEGLQHGISPTSLAVLLDPERSEREKLDASLRALMSRLSGIKNSSRSGSVHQAIRILKDNLNTAKNAKYDFKFEKVSDLPTQIADLTEYNVQAKMVARLTALMYYKTTLLAIHYSDSLSLVYPTAYKREVNAKVLDSVAVGLQFVVSTNLVEPTGFSALLDGLVYTTEPLEVLMYCRDNQADTPIVVKPTRLPSDIDTSRTAQDWAWYNISKRLNVRTTISGTLGEKEYKVIVTERDLLSVAADISSLYRTANTALVAGSYTYLRSALSRVALMEEAKATFTATDPRVISYHSMIKGELTKLMDVLSDLSRTPAATALRATMLAKIRTQMDGQGNTDLYGAMDKLRFQLYTDLRIGGILLSFVMDDDIEKDLTNMIAYFSKYSMFSDLLSKRIADRTVKGEH